MSRAVGSTKWLLVLALALALGPAASAAQRGKKHDDDRHRAEDTRAAGRGRSYFEQHGHTKLNIPPGHYPPPGACRVWFPGRPPGQQPPPGGCNVRVPRGAWLIRHPHDRPDHVHVVAYDHDRPGTILAVGEFRIGTGVFVRVVVDR